MSAVPVEGKITSLDGYSTWLTAREEQKRAFNETPRRIDTNDPAQLRQQLGYLATQEEEHAARLALMEEIASQDDRFLPVTYRLGALAAFKATDVPLRTRAEELSMLVRGGRHEHEQQLRPSSNPIKLTEQVGNELERLRGLLDTKKDVPVVMVWNHHFIPPRIDYDEVVTGNLPNPSESIVLEAPKVTEVDGQRVVDYALPSRLHGVEKGRVVSADEYLQPEEKYRNPVITTLVRLGVVKSSFLQHDPDALYIGKDEVGDRVAKAEHDKQAFQREIERRRSSRLRLPTW